MKTKEELNSLKEEIESLNEKLSALTDEELEQVVGGRVKAPERFGAIAPIDELKSRGLGGTEKITPNKL